jgi:hypothetical protein
MHLPLKLLDAILKRAILLGTNHRYVNMQTDVCKRATKPELGIVSLSK